MSGEYKKTSPFTVFRNGDIAQHYDSTKYSDFLGSKSVDKKVIVILLENLPIFLLFKPFFIFVIYNR